MMPTNELAEKLAVPQCFHCGAALTGPEITRSVDGAGEMECDRCVRVEEIAFEVWQLAGVDDPDAVDAVAVRLLDHLAGWSRPWEPLPEVEELERTMAERAKRRGWARDDIRWALAILRKNF